MIAIIDYGLGNLRSVQKAVEKAGGCARITQNPADVISADKVVFPGVGAIAPAMAKLRELKLIPAIISAVQSGKPFLGICVGFQLLFEKSYEYGDIDALGILKGEVRKFSQLKVPQMGWNQIRFVKTDCPLFKGISDESFVYFCHSYYADPQDRGVIAANTEYGVSYCSAVWRDNLFGVQFHPEKSQDIGLKIIENFVRAI